MDYVIIGIVALLVVLALAYIIKAKKSGKKCIGCPDSSCCGGNCSSCGSDCPSASNSSNNNSTTQQ